MMIKKTKLAADMTTEGAMVCQRCYQALPKGVTLTRGYKYQKKRPGVYFFFLANFVGLTNLHNQERF